MSTESAMTARRPQWIVPRLPAVALLTVVLLAALLPSCGEKEAPSLTRPGSSLGTSDDDFEYIIEPGNEDTIMAGVAPFSDGDSVGGGYVLAQVTVARGTVQYRLETDGGDGWVGIDAWHAGDRSMGGEVVASDARVELALSHPPQLSADQAQAIARPVLDRLLANSETLVAIWTPRASHRGEPGRADPSDELPSDDEGDLDGSSPIVDEITPVDDSLVRQFLTADNILIGVGVLLGLLILASGLPAFLRKKK